MAREQLKHTDISNTPELLSLAKEVQRTQKAQVLMHNSEEVAVVRPIEQMEHQNGARTLPHFADPGDIWASYDANKVKQPSNVVRVCCLVWMWSSFCTTSRNSAGT